MSNTLQVANSFVVEYFERLATNPSQLASFYGPHATLTINDIEMGITEANGEDVPFTLERWAAILESSKLRVESVNSAALYSGINVFVTFTANSDALQQHFQSTITLEAYPSGFNAEGYYIRHQVISRIGVLTHDAIDTEEASQSAANEEPVQNEDNESVHDSIEDDEHEGHPKTVNDDEEDEDHYDENDANDSHVAATPSKQTESETPNNKHVTGDEAYAHKKVKATKLLHKEDIEDEEEDEQDEADVRDESVNRESTSESANNTAGAANGKDDGKHEAIKKDDESHEHDKVSSAEQEKPTKIKSWASLASTAAHKSAAPTRVVRVVASEAATRKEEDNKPRTSTHAASANSSAIAANNTANNNTHAKHHGKENNKDVSKESNSHGPAAPANTANGSAANTANTNSTANGTTSSTSTAASAAAAGGANKNNAAREFARRDRRPQEVAGDRLMFSIDFPITDDEIKAAMGAVSASLVSLRNNSDRGHVFMDFAPNIRAFDVIKRANMTFGPNKTRVNVYRQRARE